MEGDVIWSEKWTSNTSKVVTKTLKKYLDNFMKIFLDDVIVYNDMESHLQKFT
jgi:hypothetical protein